MLDKQIINSLPCGLAIQGRFAMANAVWLGMIFGPLLFIIGLWMLMFTHNLMKITASIKNSLASFWLIGFVNLLLGLVIVSLYNRWVWNGTLLVTLLGWFMIIRGLFSFFVPRSLIIITMNNYHFLKSMGFIPLLWGLGLIWVAFFM